MEATITIAGVETKEGTSAAGKHWRLFKVKDEQGSFYSTFDAAMGQQASGSIGRVARIGFEQTEKGRNLTSLHVTNDVPAPAAPPAASSSSGTDDPDWHRIGVQKTRCALWAALFQAGMTDAKAASRLVYQAELDIFTRTLADGSRDEGIPF